MTRHNGVPSDFESKQGNIIVPVCHHIFLRTGLNDIGTWAHAYQTTWERKLLAERLWGARRHQSTQCRKCYRPWKFDIDDTSKEVIGKLLLAYLKAGWQLGQEFLFQKFLKILFITEMCVLIGSMQMSQHTTSSQISCACSWFSTLVTLRLCMSTSFSWPVHWRWEHWEQYLSFPTSPSSLALRPLSLHPSLHPPFCLCFCVSASLALTLLGLCTFRNLGLKAQRPCPVTACLLNTLLWGINFEMVPINSQRHRFSFSSSISAHFLREEDLRL